MPLVYQVAALVKFLTKPLGLYIHIPFCEKKCNYCDFYSSFVTDELLDTYTKSLISYIKKWGGKLKNRPIDTIYFGGGTPSLMNKRLKTVVDIVKAKFNVLDSAEITLELNPTGNVEEILQSAKDAGVNRLSIGVQSGIDSELKTLGRKHTRQDIINTFSLARKFHFNNISLDIMLGLPDSNCETLKESLQFAIDLSPEHISAYVLKIEENTSFYKNKNSLNLPDDDAQAEQYLFMCDFLQKNGYKHYEISNFCKTNMESRHNLKYWHCEEYLGIGPSAHSFVNGKRFYYPRNLKDFINGTEPIADGTGGSAEEYLMLALRLSEGLNLNCFAQILNKALPENFFEKCKLFEKGNLLKYKNGNISLTENGMLVSNTVISELLECIE